VSDERMPHAGTSAGRLRELASLFLKLGTVSFGGPVAHIAMMETEVVRTREWLTKRQFLDLLGAANLIPGPTSTEMAISVGFVRAGWAGLCVAGASFILPAAVITGAFAWAYVRFGSLTQAVSALAGVKAAVIAVIAIAIWRLGKTAVKDFGLAVLGATALAAFFLGLSPLVILFGGGLIGMLTRRVASLRAAAALLVAPLFPRSRLGITAAGKNWTS
jgi:chromate transporter